MLYEPFGGLCSGLAACLRNGLSIKQCIYSDVNPVATSVAIHRVQTLQQQYPGQLSPSAVHGSLDILPADVTAVTKQQLQHATLLHPGVPWLVIAGSPCQDVSQAGTGEGLAGTRSQLLYQLFSIISDLQQLLPASPAYTIEDVAFQHHSNVSISQHDFAAVCNIIGTPVTLDAPQFGSLAHRLRNFWTNMCQVQRLAAALSHLLPPQPSDLQQILPPSRIPMPVTRNDHDRAPFYPVNHLGGSRAAWPTIMSKAGSYAFRPGRPGSVLDISNPLKPFWTEPTTTQRELAMGYHGRTTAAPGITEEQRCQLIGQAIDANTLQCIIAVSLAWCYHLQRSGTLYCQALGALRHAQQRSMQLCGATTSTAVTHTALAGVSITSASADGTSVPPSSNSNNSSPQHSYSLGCVASGTCLTSTTLMKSEYNRTVSFVAWQQQPKQQEYQLSPAAALASGLINQFCQPCSRATLLLS